MSTYRLAQIRAYINRTVSAITSAFPAMLSPLYRMMAVGVPTTRLLQRQLDAHKRALATHRTYVVEMVSMDISL